MPRLPRGPSQERPQNELLGVAEVEARAGDLARPNGEPDLVNELADDAGTVDTNYLRFRSTAAYLNELSSTERNLAA